MADKLVSLLGSIWLNFVTFHVHFGNQIETESARQSIYSKRICLETLELLKTNT